MNTNQNYFNGEDKTTFHQGQFHSLTETVRDIKPPKSPPLILLSLCPLYNSNTRCLPKQQDTPKHTVIHKFLGQGIPQLHYSPGENDLCRFTLNQLPVSLKSLNLVLNKALIIHPYPSSTSCHFWFYRHLSYLLLLISFLCWGVLPYLQESCSISLTALVFSLTLSNFTMSSNLISETEKNF